MQKKNDVMRDQSFWDTLYLGWKRGTSAVTSHTCNIHTSSVFESQAWICLAHDRVGSCPGPCPCVHLNEKALISRDVTTEVSIVLIGDTELSSVIDFCS